jgi:diaminopimelate epimerase
MGAPRFLPAEIPFAAAGDAMVHALDVAGEKIDISVVSMGNPHAVQVVADVDAAPVARLGPLIEAHPRFPRRVNAGFMQVVDRHAIRLRVHERGAGETLACGSGACAAVAVLVRQGRVGRHVDVHLPGGTLVIDWPTDSAPVRMAGPATFVFEGEWLA